MGSIDRMSGCSLRHQSQKNLTNNLFTVLPLCCIFVFYTATSTRVVWVPNRGQSTCAYVRAVKPPTTEDSGPLLSKGDRRLRWVDALTGPTPQRRRRETCVRARVRCSSRPTVCELRNPRGNLPLAGDAGPPRQMPNVACAQSIWDSEVEYAAPGMQLIRASSF